MTDPATRIQVIREILTDVRRGGGPIAPMGDPYPFVVALEQILAHEEDRALFLERRGGGVGP